MALVRCDFFSEALEVSTSITVLLPQPAAGIGLDAAGAEGADGGAAEAHGTADADGPPLLYLLHGLSDDHTAWTRYTSLERYAAEQGLAVVMPSAGRSFYADERHGHAYWTYVSEELPQVVSQFFRVTQDPARTYVAGLSMGGYGALKLALTHPERYAGAAALSGALDVRRLAEWGERDELFGRIFGGPPGDDDDLLVLLGRLDPARVPPLHVSCGTEDELVGDVRAFVQAATAAGVDVTSDLRPGDHAWSLWDALLPDVLAWLPRP